MKVKIGNTWYDPNEQPIMIVLENQDKRNIERMHPEAKKYCMYPTEKYSLEEIYDFMEVEKGK